MLTLIPHSSVESKALWDFRSKDIATMFTFFFVLASFSMCSRVLEFITHAEKRDVLQNALHVVKYGLTVTTWCLRKRLKSNIVYLILAVCALTQCHNAFRGYYLIENTEDYQSLETELEIVLKRLWFYWGIFNLILSPSLGMMVLGHMLPYVLVSVPLVAKYGSAEMPFLSEFPLLFLCNCIAFYVFQYRELRRFYEQADSNNQRNQLQSVLESMSDSVLVIEPGADFNKSSQDDDSTELHKVEPGPVGSEVPDILFCNAQSIELFGTNLTGVQ